MKYVDLEIHTRSLCCRDRYVGICLYADGVKISCTPEDLVEPGNTINFKDYNKKKEKFSVATEYKLMWEDPGSNCAQIEELFFHYKRGKDLTFFRVRGRKPNCL